MGAGRKTETYTLAPDGYNSYGTMCVRNLKKGDLCGVIFGCKFSTIKECHAKKLFGLPAPHMAYIKNIDPGLTLFLFNYSDRTLHGIYEAASEGQLNIDPKAWSPNGTDPTPYPAQVKVRVRVRCEPLAEEKFSPVIADNYQDDKVFWFELDRGQTNKLLRLFSPSPYVRAPSTSKYAAAPSKKAIPASCLVEIGDLGAPRVDKWSSLFKSSDDSSENKGKEVAVSHGEGSRVVTRGWEVAASNADEQKAKISASQSGPSYSSVLRKMNESSNMEKKTFQTNEVPSQASKGVEDPWSSASRVHSVRQDNGGFRNACREGEYVKMNASHQQNLHPAQKGTSTIANNVIGPSKEDSAEEAYSEIDWDAASSFKVHLDGLNRILEDPRDKDCFKRFEGNMGFASSSKVPNHWEDEKAPWEVEEGYIDKSPCGSSYVSATTGDALEDNGEDKEKHHFKTEMGSATFLDILNEIFEEVKELKQTQMKQAEYMISLEMELLESRKEILRLKGLYGSS
ncbi:hypothetical protein EUTSA_v10020540mg [Eutrema salsugineum]|uniref:DCD domain-containing protein n=1 Tax=Eutrema salsugineum TaxID=72664 RepID=V4M962_EUTSA|nr:uncharacterized protein LOC18023396 [Eutrema salsugineum]ESQ48933.1 hypothetical protein EUTSA_v10020540mg [Eutrema salsugineum]